MGPVHQWLSKVYTRRTNDEAICLAVWLFYVLSRHANIMTDKGFNLFYECAARCVHLFQQEEECTSFSWVTVKCTYLVKWYCETLKAFRIISSEMKISLLILSWWCSSFLHIQRIGIQYAGQLFWKIIP